jgi:hypothetical protein
MDVSVKQRKSDEDLAQEVKKMLNGQAICQSNWNSSEHYF